MVTVDQIRQLRQETCISISECKKALEEASGDIEKAKKILKGMGRELAMKKTGRETKEGVIECYIHSGKKIGAMVEVLCETDFVARNPDFQKLAHEICLQLVAVHPEEIPLLEQPWIKDESKTIKDLIDNNILKLGENIIIGRFIRYEI